MLEHVALHQTRFNAPGIAPDARGIALGKQGALLFASLDPLVGWFRVLSDELALDDLLPTLSIVEVRSSLRSRELLLLFHATSSYLCDRAARVAGLLGGQAFTGSGKHFVKYRDDAAPFGYDVDALAADTADGSDFILYGDAFAQAYRREREIPFQQLLFRLSLRRLPGPDPALTDEGERQVLWITAPSGLARVVLGYLYRSRVAAEATLVERPARSAFEGQGPDRYLLARARDLPARILALFQALPGIAVYRPATDNVVVEVGFRHPLRLESCQAVFPKDRFHLFSGRSDTVDVVAGSPADGTLALAGADRYLDVGLDGDAASPAASATVAAQPRALPEELTVRVRLAPAPGPPPRVSAALVPWLQAAWLKRLVFALPPTVLAGCRAAPLDAGLLVLAEGGVECVPLGELFHQAAPGVFLPLGQELLPHLPEAMLAEHLGTGSGRRVFFRRVGARFAVADEAFEPLGRRMMGRLAIDPEPRSERAGEPAPPPPSATVTNDPIGPFPLWGYRGDALTDGDNDG